MTDFDKLIKEKVEQADYAYKPSAWMSFQRQTGMGHGTLKYWVAGVSSVAVIGGLSTFLLLRTPDLTQGNEPAPNAVALDTVSMLVDEDATVGNDTLSVAGSCEQKTPRNKAVYTAVSEPDMEKSNDDANPSSGTNKPKKSTAPRYRRPLVIDVDTIKDNVPTDEELRNGNSRLF